MKSILRASLLLSTAFAFGQDNPVPKAQAQPPGTTKREAAVVVDLSEVIKRNVPSPMDVTERALKDRRGLCRVHHEVLRAATVPILYGLRPAPLYPPRVEENLFPNAFTGVGGGCPVMPRKEAVVLQCPKCVRARERWERRQIAKRRY